jgi:FlaA1/EpsC-like NDP-sugar epimerase
MWLWVVLMAVLRPLTIYAFTGYRSIWRYLHLQDVTSIATASLLPSLLLLVLLLNFRHLTWAAAVPLSIVILEYAAFFFVAISARAFRRATYEAAKLAGNTVIRALILGTDETLPAAVRQAAAHADLEVIGLVAPEERLLGRDIGGVPVIAMPEQLPELLVQSQVQIILIADSSLECVAATVSTATEFGIDVRLMPSAANIIRGEARVATPLKPEHAFSERNMIPPPAAQVTACYTDKVVFISGAGGSIGAEISRQAARMPVKKVVLFDHDENSIFEINNELLAMKPRGEIAPVVGDIRDSARLHHVFAAHRPHIVIHAAAYKHVPVMEYNAGEAIMNNVIATRELASAAIQFGAERFLMISTDKAVKPTSIMGASKRVAEQLVRAHALQRPASTRFACVRFGNVVGSRGSVIPIFLRQIAAGQPLTITDEQMTRYFMTIPEAVQLVLQASTLDADGDIFMLDMGDPIKIVALARKLIEMSGLVPEKDVPIKIVGVRPGEKIHEQLWHDDADIARTPFDRVWQVSPETLPPEFERQMEELERAAIEHRDADAARLVKAMAPVKTGAGQTGTSSSPPRKSADSAPGRYTS